MTKTTKDKMATKTHLGKISLEFPQIYPLHMCTFIPIILCTKLFRHNVIIPQYSLVTNLVVHLVRTVTVVASQSTRPLLMW